jgi:hypothetical protein
LFVRNSEYVCMTIVIVSRNLAAAPKLTGSLMRSPCPEQVIVSMAEIAEQATDGGAPWVRRRSGPLCQQGTRYWASGRGQSVLLQLP